MRTENPESKGCCGMERLHFDFDEMLDNVKVHHILIHGELVDGKMEFTEAEN